MRSPERSDRPPRPGVLTFAQIREERERDRAREEERRRRQRERDRERERRQEEEDRRQRESERRRRAEEDNLRAMREEIRREREKIDREKADLIRLERDRQRVERERLQREKDELERLRRQQASRLEEAHRSRKRPVGIEDHRDPYYDERKRSNPGPSSSGSGSRDPGGRSYDRGYEDRGGRYNPPPGASSATRDSRDYRGGGPGDHRSSAQDHRNRPASSRSSNYPWAPGSGPPSGAPKPPYPPLMSGGASGSSGDWNPRGNSGPPQAPQPPVLSGAPSFSGNNQAFRGGQSSYSTNQFDPYKNPMMNNKRY